MAGKKLFYLYRRKNIYYVQLKNPRTGKPLPARSTGQSNKEKAEYIARKWVFEGLPESTDQLQTQDNIHAVDEALSILKETKNLSKQDVKRFLHYFKSKGFLADYTLSSDNEITVIDYLLNFWDYKKSPYVLEKKAYGHSIGLRRCKEAGESVNLHWKPYFKNTLLTSIDKQILKNFSLFLSKKKKVSRDGSELDETLSALTINRIIGYGTIAFKWAYKNDLILNDPTIGLMNFSGQQRKRGILTDDEVKKLFTSGDWRKNEGAKLGNLLACQTGMRAGEIIALRIRDIGTDRLFIRHSWSNADGLKSTKTNMEREIPILPDTRSALLDYARKNPHGFTPDSFVFFQMDTDERPMRQETLLSRLRFALESIDILIEEQKARNIVFHSWRHYYARKMADVLSERTAKLTGHLTPEMLEHYANHANKEDFKKAADATSKVFGRILEFKVKEA